MLQCLAVGQKDSWHIDPAMMFEVWQLSTVKLIVADGNGNGKSGGGKVRRRGDCELAGSWFRTSPAALLSQGFAFVVAQLLLAVLCVLHLAGKPEIRLNRRCELDGGKKSPSAFKPVIFTKCLRCL